MKSSLKKLRGFALHKNDSKEKRNYQPPAQLDELAQASQDMQDMRNCYDSLLSAAAATANSAFEFSESLREMGACLLEKTSMNDDEDSGRVLLMLGKVQYELQKLVDSYRSHIFQTITNPSESLLSELRTVEEMKRQCDEKRNIYEYMAATQRVKGKSRGVKGESFSAQQLQAAREEYDDEATLFVFRLKSLRQGQPRSLLTQAARHHAAQLNFFRRGLKSLEAVEAHVKLVTEQQHIDYQFNGLEDDDAEDDDEDDGSDANYDGELSFDYGQNDHGQDAISTARNSMELDPVDHIFPPVITVETAQENIDKIQRNPYSGASQSAPIFPDRKFDASERISELRPSRKFHTYVLPTPVDAKNVTLAGSSNQNPDSKQESISMRAQNLWHSSPLEPKKHVKDPRDDQLSDASDLFKADSVLKESNTNTSPSQKPSPSAEGPSFARLNSGTASDTKKIKRQAFSGPLTSKQWPNKAILSASGPIASLEHPLLVSGMLSRVPVSQPAASHKISPCSSPPLLPSPKINELHELPRPPIGLSKPTSPSYLIAHSAPLMSKSQELSTTAKFSSRVTHVASPLPTPPGPMPRSFSIPSSSQKAQTLQASKFMETTPCTDMTEVASPPLTPIPFPTSATTDVLNHSRKPKGVD